MDMISQNTHRFVPSEEGNKLECAGGTPVQLEAGKIRAGAYFAGTLRRPGCQRRYQRSP